MKVILAYVLILLSIFIILIYSSRRNNNFINIYNIIKEHFKIFGGAKKHIIVIYIMPIFTSIGIALIHSFSVTMIEVIFIAISVVISSLLAFQGTVINLDRKNENERKKQILLETNASINFTVLINIYLIFIMLIYIWMESEFLKSIFTGVIVYVLMVTFLTVLIILKRVRVLLNVNI